MGKTGKEFEVVCEGGKNRKKLVTLPIVASSPSEAKVLAEPIRIRRRLGSIVRTQEKPKK